MSDQSGESSMVRTYLEWLSELPWSAESGADIDIAKAREVLEADHHGLEKIKRRILEYLAVRKLNPAGKAPILCFVGPPGVGKTSLGQSIARATGREFARVSLGGVHEVFLAVAPDAQVEMLGERVDHGDADAVQAAGYLVGVLVELPAGMQLGHDDLGG